MRYEGRPGSYWLSIGSDVRPRRPECAIDHAVETMRSAGEPDVEEAMLGKSLINRRIPTPFPRSSKRRRWSARRDCDAVGSHVDSGGAPARAGVDAGIAADARQHTVTQFDVVWQGAELHGTHLDPVLTQRLSKRLPVACLDVGPRLVA